MVSGIGERFADLQKLFPVAGLHFDMQETADYVGVFTAGIVAYLNYIGSAIGATTEPDAGKANFFKKFPSPQNCFRVVPEENYSAVRVLELIFAGLPGSSITSSMGAFAALSL